MFSYSRTKLGPVVELIPACTHLRYEHIFPALFRPRRLLLNYRFCAILHTFQPHSCDVEICSHSGFRGR